MSNIELNENTIIKVRCVNNSGYPDLTTGKIYDVIEFIPRLICQNFTFPRYVTVENDWGSKSTGHAYRFQTIEGESCEDYIKNNFKDDYENEGLKKTYEKDIRK